MVYATERKRKPRRLKLWLESSFDRNLERSWAALVVERAGIPEALIEHLGGLAKKKVREGRIDIPEVGMIEDVERLDLQLQIHYFPKLIRLPDTKIPLHFRESAEEIARRVSRHGRIRQGQCRVHCVLAAIEH